VRWKPVLGLVEKGDDFCVDQGCAGAAKTLGDEGLDEAGVDVVDADVFSNSASLQASEQ
jgi:hypothetical protein